MKRLFAKATRQNSSTTASTPRQPPANAISNSVAHNPQLKPKYTVPPTPHPPHDHIALLVTNGGLLLRPHVIGATLESHVKIAWGKQVQVTEQPGDGDEAGDWSEAVIVYGIVGALELLEASYVLVVSAKQEIGHLFEETHAIYGVKGVTAIPLSRDRARIVLNTLGAKNAGGPRPSLIPTLSIDSVSPVKPLPQDDKSGATAVANLLLPQQGPDTKVDKGTEGSATRVKFAEENQVKLMTPMTAQPPSSDEDYDFPPSPSSGASTPTSVVSTDGTSPIAKTLAERLSFWSRLSKRTSVNQTDSSMDSSDNKTQEEARGSPLTELAKSVDEAAVDPTVKRTEVVKSIVDATAPAPETTAAQHVELENKVVRECIREYTKGGMYFAYDFDITRSLQHKQRQHLKSHKERELLSGLGASSPGSSPNLGVDMVDVLAEPYRTLPLWRRVDRQYWWNEWLSKPFVDAGLHSYVLPIMQGYYQIANFHIPREPEASEVGDAAQVDYILISRRSRDRAGLRYQRRGIDEDANVANFVETEAIMRVDREGVTNVFSYVQLRGSIPLFWSQPGYSLKPAPVLATDRTHAQQLDAIRRHFQKTVPKYGPNAIINLAEQHGREGQVTCGYRDFAVELDWADVQYNEYDFHQETKGMKYENIASLIETMQRTFEAQGYFWVSDGRLMSEQKGIFRVNCIDCLDRTNVVQSAFARYSLNRMLGAVALLASVEHGKTEVDVVFNDVWANNGDAISRAYAGTSALKGDFTRTGKRDLNGMLNDGLNSLARMYTSTFSDWFAQAVIDFMLGNRTASVFSEFLLKLQSSDPRDLIRVTKIRAEAIATSVARVLPEGERLLRGWTLAAPEDLNTKLVVRFEEKVLLLSATALYIVSYDYSLEKVKMYTRVPLGDITKIGKGAYILSPLEEASRDPVQNAGFVLSWNSQNQETRVTSYAVRNTADLPSTPTTPSGPKGGDDNSGGGEFPLLAAFPPLLARVPVRPPSTVDGGSGRPTPSRRGTALSRLLTKAAPAGPSETTWAAFKVLPVDPARVRQGSTGSFADAAGDDLSAATNCREAVEMIVDAIQEACSDVGNVAENLVVEEDVVSLVDAQKMTSVYAKMEYGVKRLLWLGG